MKKFRFKTRTRSIGIIDYKVYGENGTKIFPESEFKPVADKAQWDEEPCVVMYEDNEGIYVAVFGMDRGVKDVANRPRKFSFYEVFDNKISAWAAFKRMVLEWSEAEEVMRSLIRETPKKDTRDEDVFFDEEKFSAWLQEKRKFVQFSNIKADEKVNISSLKSGDAFMPKNDCVLKWDKEGDDIYCFRYEKNKSKSVFDDENDFGGNSLDIREGKQGINKRSKPDKKNLGGFIVVACLIICVIGLGLSCYILNNKLTNAQNKIEKKSQEIKSLNEKITNNENIISELNEKLDEKDEKISELNETITSQDKRILKLEKDLLKKKQPQEEPQQQGEPNQQEEPKQEEPKQEETTQEETLTEQENKTPNETTNSEA